MTDLHAPPSETAFDPDAVRVFRFLAADFDAQTGVAQLRYAFDDGEPMIETLRFPGAPFALTGARAAAVARALRCLHLIAGVSYYKAAAPPVIAIEGEPIDVDTGELLNLIYRRGLGEYAHRNGLDLDTRIAFPAIAASSVPSAPALGLRAHALVAIGGGKDSLVSVEVLRAAAVEQTLAWVGGSQLIAACARRTGLPACNIARQLAPALFALNRRGARNGHIPVTAVNSAILVLAALLYDCDQVVFSNEHSASYGSRIAGSSEVNHQWSKGWEFEAAFAAWVRRHIAADLHYFSLLRPFSELAVARRFARSNRYDDVFSSCNRNFHILGERPASRWCGQCPKCRFVFLALAAFMPKPRLVAIFGRNLLDEPAQAEGYDALLEYQAHKPFECVGEARESRAALASLAQSASWREDAIVRRFALEIVAHLDTAPPALATLLAWHEPQQIPGSLREVIRADFAT